MFNFITGQPPSDTLSRQEDYFKNNQICHPNTRLVIHPLSIEHYCRQRLRVLMSLYSHCLVTVWKSLQSRRYRCVVYIQVSKLIRRTFLDVWSGPTVDCIAYVNRRRHATTYNTSGYEGTYDTLSHVNFTVS
jgi:hypothetical protein